MIWYKLRSAWRNLIAHPLFSFINVFGLAIGMASCLVVYLFIADEQRYDRHNKDADRIYRIISNAVNENGVKTTSPTTPPALAPAIKEQLPEALQTVRLFAPASGWGWNTGFFVRYGEKKFVEENLYRADSSIFDVFTLPFISGSAKTALNLPNSIVLTESTAKKYFGRQNPMGKILQVDDWEPQLVTGVIKDLPPASHFKMDLLISLQSLNEGDRLRSQWNWNSFYTYVKLQPGTNTAAFDKKIQQVFAAHHPESKNEVYTQPLTSIHLHSNFIGELAANSDASYSYIFGIICLLILLSACINYINLTTARAAVRAKEIGIRQIAGAGKIELLKQFLLESLLSAFLAALLSLLMAGLFLPVVNTVTGKQLGLFSSNHYLILPGVWLFAVVLGLVAGIYPALHLASFKPVQSLTQQKNMAGRHINLRKMLVVTQFVISITLIIGILVVGQQVKYIREAKLGLDTDQVIIVNDIGFLDRNERTILRDALMKVPGVKLIAATDGVPGGYNWSKNVCSKGLQNSQLINFLSVDDAFIPAFNMQLKEGRNFSALYSTDTTDAVILNETAVNKLSVPAPVIGHQVEWNKNPHTGEISYATIIGIVKDFRFSSMKNDIAPFAFVKRNKRQWEYAVKMSGQNTAQTLAGLKKAWDQHVSTRPFQYTFLDTVYAKLYAAEMNFKAIFTCISLLAIVIACMGLLGLSLFITKQRSRELSIRKILGASAGNIAALLSKDFVQLIIAASLIAFPAAWWLASKWLQGYAYRIQISWKAFILGDALVLGAALLTISIHTAKASLTNPVNSLRQH